ncbi:MAG: caspase family protein [candidate division Zixibacteria bacterium]|nr:caspase family protein [candidate division Zixibacteria bacterium]
MKKILISLFLCGIILAMFGCSDNPDITDSQNSIVMTERPQYIETRPPAVVESHTLKTTMAAYKKPTPPPPPPDTLDEDPNPNPAHKYAYIVGISDYEGTANDLQYCDDDAVEMKALLQGEGFTVRMDLDGNATADNIDAGLQWLIDQASPGDEIAFCYSGHGTKYTTYGSCIISADLYLMTHGYVMQYFNAVNCTKKLMTLDACVIGDFHLDVMSGTVMATASTNTSSYDVPAFENGAWTYFFLEGANEQGLIFAEAVASYAEVEMKAWAKVYHLRVSPKHTDLYEGMFDM